MMHLYVVSNLLVNNFLSCEIELTVDTIVIYLNPDYFGTDRVF